MKNLVIFILVTGALLLGELPTKAQVKEEVEEKVEEKVEGRIDQRTDEAIDKGLDKIEKGIGKLFGKKKKKEKDKDKEQEQTQTESADQSQVEETESITVKEKGPMLNWAKYDFVPGDKIIFDDNQANEENGEFPSRWDLVEGRVENAVFDNQNVIYFMTASSQIIPYLKNRDQDYLPDEFTLEFDAWFETEEYTSYIIWFRDVKNHENTPDELYRQIFSVTAYSAATLHNKFKGMYPGADYEWNTSEDTSFWRHVSVSFNRRAMKVYLDETRLLNVPNMEINPMGITIGVDGFNTAGVKGINRFIKDVRIAEGAVKLYDKLMQDGKIIANGIRFDVNKATLKPESMGIINEIAELMKENLDIKFSVEGHTDSDGTDASNQILSERRAEAVVAKLTTMGISAERFISKGWGESKPFGTNDTAEGKAANRRVEFIKM